MLLGRIELLCSSTLVLIMGITNNMFSPPNCKSVIRISLREFFTTYQTKIENTSK